MRAVTPPPHHVGWTLSPRGARALAASLLFVAACSAPPSERVVANAAPVTTTIVDMPEPEPEPTVSSGPSRPLELPFLEGEATDVSVSVGDTSHGRLVGARELVESEELSILPKQKARDLRYGTAALVELLTRAAHVLHEGTGTRLWVGNLGRREGGDIPWSVSHNAGRDADVAFAYVNANGKAVDPPDLVPLGKTGVSKDGTLRLDARRMWIIVRAMVETPGVDLQYLFISEPLRKKVLEQAKLLGAPPAIIERAASLLRQPRGSAPHDDHLHVRIHCSLTDSACGCIDTGPVDAESAARVEARVSAAARARQLLEEPRADTRRRATLRLGMIGDPADRRLVTQRLEDPDATVRAAAAAALGTLGDERDAVVLVTRFRDEREPAAAAAMLESAAKLGGADAGALLRDLIAIDPFGATTPDPFMLPPRCPDDLAGPLRMLAPPVVDPATPINRAALRSLAVRASARADRLEPVAALVPLIDPRDPALAKDALAALGAITNHPPPKDLTSDTAITDAAATYVKLVKTMGSAPRDAWLVHGFAARGYRIQALDRRFGWELVRATADVTPISYNARKLLARMLGEAPDATTWSAGDACRHFRTELTVRRAELGVGRPNDAQRVACFSTAKDDD